MECCCVAILILITGIMTGWTFNEFNNMNSRIWKINWLKVANIGFFICNIILIGFNTHLLCNEYPRNENLGFDYLGVIVGIFSLLVTVLLGWNIYTVIDFKKKADELNKKVQKLNEESEKNTQMALSKTEKKVDSYINESMELDSEMKQLKEKIEKLKADTTFGNIFDNATRMEKSNNLIYALDGYMDALNVAITDGLQQDRIDVSIDAINRIIKSEKEHKNPIYILPKTKEIYCDIISSVKPQNETTRSIYTYLYDNSFEKGEEFPNGEVKKTSEYHTW